MSQQPYHQVIVNAPSSNGLGTAGFVVSLLGFLTCGLISPIGLLFSVIALLKPPRGMAFAGTVLGLLGCWWLFAGGLVMVAGIAGIGAASSLPDPPVVTERPDETIESDSEPDSITGETETEATAPMATKAATTIEPPPASQSIKVDDPPVDMRPNAWRFAERTWIVNGEPVQGKFRSMTAGVVTIETTFGDVIKSPLAELGDDDKAFIARKR